MNNTGKNEVEIASTAVQIRSEKDLTCRIIYGTPLTVQQGQRGKIALFGPGCLVGYEIVRGRTMRAFLFRTSAGKGSEKVPGAYPPVRLLLTARSREHTRKLIRSIAFLKRQNIIVEALPELFFSRMQVLLSDPRFCQSTIRELLFKCRKSIG